MRERVFKVSVDHWLEYAEQQRERKKMIAAFNKVLSQYRSLNNFYAIVLLDIHLTIFLF
jgi:N-acetylglucosamine kinase-like BadF-type ATPase